MRPDAVRAMLEARSVAVVGASARPGSFGERLVTEVTRSPSRPTVYLVNPRYPEVQGLPCLPSLDDVPDPVDLVLLGVGDAALPGLVKTIAVRGDRSAVVFASASSVGAEIAETARSAGVALCGAGCMGFLNVAGGLRAIGYLERDELPTGPVGLVSHSGSAFSALLRTHRRIGFSAAISSGQELVTTTADYLDYLLDQGETSVLALFLETVREPARLRAALDRARDQDVPVVLLAVGGTPSGGELVRAHSGALAGADAAWEALTESHDLLRVDDLDEMTDLLELLVAGRRGRPGAAGSGLATVHDSGAERVLVADVATRLGVPFAQIGAQTTVRLQSVLDPGLTPGNPLDVWGSGHRTRELFGSCLRALADDAAVQAVALAVDLVEEYDGDDSYPLAALDAASATDKPVAVLANIASAVDQQAAERLRAAGVPVLEGTRSGLRALGRLLDLTQRRLPEPAVIETDRQQRWADRLARQPLTTDEQFELLRDYGIGTVDVEMVSDRAGALVAAQRLGWPVVLKTDEEVAHKTDVDGVHLGLVDDTAVVTAYDDLADRLGPRVLVSETAAPGIELALGMTVDPMLGPIVVAGAGGVLVEVLRDRAVGLPPLDRAGATRLVDQLAVRALLDRFRGGPPVDMDSVVTAVVAVAQLALELGDVLRGLDINPLIAGPRGAVAADVLIVAR